MIKTVTDFIFLGSRITADGDCSHEKMLAPWKKSYDQPAAAAAAKSLQSCLTLCNPETAAHQAPPSLGFSRQEHWGGLPFPSPMHESEN